MRLSKSRFISGCQCHRRLWYDVHQPELAICSSAQTYIFETGTILGEIARKRFPEGYLIEADHKHMHEALEETQARLTDPNQCTLFEAAFLHGDVFVRPDVLERAPNGKWNLIEVKATSSVKPYHELDVAIQTWVVQGSGVELQSSALMTINKGYVFDGKQLNYRELFQLHDKTDLAQGHRPFVEEEVARQFEMLSKDVPDIQPGPQCDDPFECPYFSHCNGEIPVPEHPLSELNGMRKERIQDMKSMGIETIPEIPDTTTLSPLHQHICSAVKSQKEWISPSLSAALNTIEAPVHFLDFETFSPVIPLYAGTRAYQRIPFQWSCHHEDDSGNLTHSAFLAKDMEDPREALALSLLETLGNRGSIVVYSPFEKSVIRSLADTFPHLASRLLALNDRMVDLLQIIKAHYYHPAFHGSFSIKQVLPVLVPALSYKELAITGGDVAPMEFQRMMGSQDAEERNSIYTNLLAYCAMDTLAMVEVLKVMKSKIV